MCDRIDLTLTFESKQGRVFLLSVRVDFTLLKINDILSFVLLHFISVNSSSFSEFIFCVFDYCSVFHSFCHHYIFVFDRFWMTPGCLFPLGQKTPLLLHPRKHSMKNTFISVKMRGLRSGSTFIAFFHCIKHNTDFITESSKVLMDCLWGAISVKTDNRKLCLLHFLMIISCHSSLSLCTA